MTDSCFAYSMFFFCIFGLSLSSSKTSENYNCEMTSAKVFKIASFKNGFNSYQSWVYSGFSSVSELKFECDIQTLNNTLDLKSDQEFYVIFDYKMKKIIDESVDVRPFFEMVNIAYFSFYNVDGFDVELNDSFIITSADTNSISGVYLYYSKFDFYFRGKLINASLCDAGVLENVNITLFSGFKYTTLVLSVGTDFTNQICPYVFKKATIVGLRIDNLEDNRLYRHMISFLEIKNENDIEINIKSNLQTINLSGFYKLNIGLDLFDKYTLRRAFQLCLVGDITGIQKEFFRTFSRLNLVQIIPVDAFRFYRSSFNEWLMFLHYNGPSYSNKAEMRMEFGNGSDNYFFLMLVDKYAGYSFPEEDFCLFKHFPLDKAVISEIQSKFQNSHGAEQLHQLNSCTYKFLSQNNAFLSRLLDIYYQQGIGMFYESELDECNFAERLLLCQNTSFFNVERNQRSYHFTNYLDVIYVFAWLEFLGPIVTFSSMSLLALTLNLFVILIITSKKNHKEKLFESKLFKYIRMYSAFNCVECFIYQFKLLSICMGPGMIYCSSIRANMFTQYFTITVVGYLSETTKTCSIITGTLFSLQRYIETTKPESRLLESFAQVRMRFVAVFTLLVSMLISVSKIFEYEVYEDIYMSHDLPFSFAIYVYNDRDGVQARTVFYFLHYFLNDFAFLVLNLFIDIKLVLNIKSNLSHKLNFKNKSLDSGEKLTKMQKTRLKEELIKKRKAENKANEMIILIVIIYLFCRLPELVGMIYTYYKPFWSNSNLSCKSSTICYFVSNLVEYFYMLSYIFNIILYYKFNSNFRKGFRIFFNFKSNISKGKFLKVIA